MKKKKKVGSWCASHMKLNIDVTHLSKSSFRTPILGIEWTVHPKMKKKKSHYFHVVPNLHDFHSSAEHNQFEKCFHWLPLFRQKNTMRGKLFGRQHSAKHHLLCSAERFSFKFGMTWRGWVNVDNIFIFWVGLSL